jgi:hypothetical protein
MVDSPDDRIWGATAAFTSMTPVASTTLLVITATSEETFVTAAIGQPYRAATGEWLCPVRLTGLHERLPDMAGADSLQALCMAASLVRSLLEAVVDEGGRVLDAASRSEYPLDAVFGRVGRGSGAPTGG